jgi:nucleoside-diphosphate-sugar epimerase
MITYGKKNIQTMYKTNIEGTSNVVNVALSSGVKKMLYMSSIAAIGGKPNEIITENTKWEDNEWTTNYGITKQMAERQIFRGIEEGLQATIINPGMVVGVGNNENKSTVRLLKHIAEQKMPFYPAGATGFVDVEDVARLSILLMQGNYNGERFIAVSENRRFKQYFEAIAQALNVEPPKKQLNRFTSSVFYNMDALLSFFNQQRKRGYTKESAKVAMENFNYSNQKIKENINYQFVPLEQTLQKTVKEYKNGNR